MKSIRLTLRLRPEQECVVDCLAKIEEGFAISLELRDGGVDVPCRSVAHGNEPAGGQQQSVDAVQVAQTGSVLEVQKGSAMGNLGGGNRNLGVNQLTGQNLAHGVYSANPPLNAAHHWPESPPS